MHVDAAGRSRIINRSDGTVLYYGRPSWLGAELMAQLAAEAASRRQVAKRINERNQMGATAGEAGLALADSPALNELIAELTGPVCFSGDANYLYYEQAGAGIDPHIDRDEFNLQILLMIEHNGYSGTRSSLTVFPRGPKDALFMPMDPGELVLFRAASVIHGRTPVTQGERVRLLGIGYRSDAVSKAV